MVRRVDIVASNLVHFLLLILKFLKILFGKFKDIRNYKLQSCTKRILQNELPSCRFPIVLKTSNFKEGGALSQNSGIKIFQLKKIC